MKKLEKPNLKPMKHSEHRDISEIIAESEMRVRKFLEEREAVRSSHKRETNREQGSDRI